MALIIYMASMTILFAISRKSEDCRLFRHGTYTSFILPAVIIPVKRIIKSDLLKHGPLLMALYGPAGNTDLLAAHWGMKVSAFLIFTVFPVGYLSFINTGNADILISLAFPVVGFFLPDMELKTKLMIKKNGIMAEYPIFCTDIAVLVGAGMEVTAAWKTAAGKTESGELYKEARLAVLRTETGTMFSDSLREFASRLSVPEINTFVTIINQELKAGCGGMEAKLSGLAALAWKTRETECREMGEKAAAKLVFPLAVGLAGIILILAAPAVMVMKGI